jgi:hypothetical protein
MQDDAERTLHDFITRVRGRLNDAFASDTSYDGTSITSRGHCAAVAAILARAIGCDVVSAVVNGESHWFNRVTRTDGSGEMDFDITGDQFGLEPVRMGPAGSLFVGTRVRSLNEIDAQTFARAQLLAFRARLQF